LLPGDGPSALHRELRPRRYDDARALAPEVCAHPYGDPRVRLRVRFLRGLFSRCGDWFGAVMFDRSGSRV
jgi:hypothetical protein